MLRCLVSLVLLVTTFLALPAPAGAEGEPERSIRVTGEGVSTYPAFDPRIQRYAATTTVATGARLVVEARTSDPAGSVRINGRERPDGVATVTGLAGGDEVSVIIEDAAGRTSYSIVHLPAGFPRLETTVASEAATPGSTLVTLNRFDQSGSPTFEASLDANGVPGWLQAFGRAGSMDLKPDGQEGYTVFRREDPSGPDGAELVRLDSAFNEVDRSRTVGLTHTDGHDVILRGDGGRVMLAYEPDGRGRTDAVIQEVDASGEVVREWNSADHMNPVPPGLPAEERPAAIAATDTMNPYVGDWDGGTGRLRGDYAHINSIQLVDGGQNMLASFRNTSSVLKIAWAEDREDGREPGEVIWRLGGRFSDFRFEDDPYAGPCTQHTASQLENGHVLIFDNGAPDKGNSLFPDQYMCPDPEDPSGEPVGRPFTRVTEYALDEATGTARLVWSYPGVGPDPDEHRFAYFAGGAQRLDNGNTLINWASDRTSVATEVTAGGEEVWEVRDPAGAGVYFSYRAVRAVVPDAIEPEVVVGGFRDGRTVRRGADVTVEHECRDRGGSNLEECGIDLPDGRLDTASLGAKTFTVQARDGAGNTTERTLGYTVEPKPVARPDAMIRKPRRRWVGTGVRGTVQQVGKAVGPRRRRAVFRVRVDNQGPAATRVRLRGGHGNRHVRVRWFAGQRNVTRKVVSGRYRTPRLRAGQRHTLRLVTNRKPRARRGGSKTVRLLAVSVRQPVRRDAVRAVVRVRR